MLSVEERSASSSPLVASASGSVGTGRNGCDLFAVGLAASVRPAGLPLGLAAPERPGEELAFIVCVQCGGDSLCAMATRVAVDGLFWRSPAASANWIAPSASAAAAAPEVTRLFFETSALAGASSGAPMLTRRVGDGVAALGTTLCSSANRNATASSSESVGAGAGFALVGTGAGAAGALDSVCTVAAGRSARSSPSRSDGRGGSGGENDRREGSSAGRAGVGAGAEAPAVAGEPGEPGELEASGRGGSGGEFAEKERRRPSERSKCCRRGVSGEPGRGDERSVGRSSLRELLPRIHGSKL